MVAGKVAMEHSFKMVKYWRDARAKKRLDPEQQTRLPKRDFRHWTPLVDVGFKVNVDASWFDGAEMFSIWYGY